MGTFKDGTPLRPHICFPQGNRWANSGLQRCWFTAVIFTVMLHVQIVSADVNPPNLLTACWHRSLCCQNPGQLIQQEESWHVGFCRDFPNASRSVLGKRKKKRREIQACFVKIQNESGDKAEWRLILFAWGHFSSIHSADRVCRSLNTNEVKSAHLVMLSQLAQDSWIMNGHGYSLASTCFNRPQKRSERRPVIYLFSCEKHSSCQMLTDVWYARKRVESNCYWERKEEGEKLAFHRGAINTANRGRWKNSLLIKTATAISKRINRTSKPRHLATTLQPACFAFFPFPPSWSHRVITLNWVQGAAGDV